MIPYRTFKGREQFFHVYVYNFFLHRYEPILFVQLLAVSSIVHFSTLGFFYALYELEETK